MYRLGAAPVPVETFSWGLFFLKRMTYPIDSVKKLTYRQHIKSHHRPRVCCCCLP